MNDITMEELMKRIRNFGKDVGSYWGCALAGEVGECCNLIKKNERDGLDIKDDLSLELADVFIYTVLTSRHFKIDLIDSVARKLDILENRLGIKI